MSSGYVWVNRDDLKAWVDTLAELVRDTEPKDAGYFVQVGDSGTSEADELLVEMESYLNAEL